MKHLTIPFILVAMLSATPAQDPLAELRQEVGFGAWPGKGGSLVAGFALDPQHYPQLRSLPVLSSSIILDGRPGVIGRELLFEAHGQELRLSVFVGQSSTDAVHERLFHWVYPTCSAPRTIPIVTSDLGDVALGVADDAGVLDAPGAWLAFARSNVGVYLSCSDRPAAVDLVSLARNLDATVQAQPPASAAAVRAAAPQIDSLASEAQLLRCLAGGAPDFAGSALGKIPQTRLSATTHDTGLTERWFSFSSRVDIEATGELSAALYASCPTEGEVRCSLVLVDEKLLHDEETVSLHVAHGLAAWFAELPTSLASISRSIAPQVDSSLRTASQRALPTEALHAAQDLRQAIALLDATGTIPDAEFALELLLLQACIAMDAAAPVDQATLTALVGNQHYLQAADHVVAALTP